MGTYHRLCTTATFLPFSPIPRHAFLPLLPTSMFLANLFLIQGGLAEAVPRQLILTVHARADLSAAYHTSSSSSLAQSLALCNNDTVANTLTAFVVSVHLSS